jgi:hypothetical protein
LADQNPATERQVLLGGQLRFHEFAIALRSGRCREEKKAD